MTHGIRATWATLLTLTVGACSRETPVVDVQGACADVYGAQVCTWAKTQGANVLQAGAVVPLASIANAPNEESSMAWPPVAVATIDLPASVQQQTGLTQLTMYWEAMGHPPGPYLTPHFDFHFYMVPSSDRMAIDCSDNSKPSALPDAYSLPDVPLPPEMASLTGVPTLIGLCVPQMGQHSLPTAELESASPFRGDMVIGYYHAKPVFVEPMLTKTMLLEKKSFDLTLPAIPGYSGPHPTTFHAEYDAAQQAYRFTFSGFAAAS
jgi:hypothetical protein